MLLLDTNVVSEPTKPRPQESVLAWMSQQRPADVFLSALTVGEIVRGILRLPNGQRRTRLQTWFDGFVMQNFAGRILPVTTTVAIRWAHIKLGLTRTISDVDQLIGATALAHDLAVVTRNERDFTDLGVRVVNPWRA